MIEPMMTNLVLLLRWQMIALSILVLCLSLSKSILIA
nr:MAG TPA: hypothetical protein [Caudoviricetes sp.]